MAEITKLDEEAENIKKSAKALSQRVATFANRLIGETDSFTVEIKSIQQSIKAAEKHARSLKAEITLQSLKEANDIIMGLGPGGDLRKFCKLKSPMALRLLVGDKTSVVSFRADQSAAMKEEYYRFRNQSANIMLLVPALLVFGMHKTDFLQVGTDREEGTVHSFTPFVMTGVQGYLIWLSYFYLAMSLRENVLLMNGSHIKPWWIQHHYVAALTSMLLLGLPVYSPAFIKFCFYFLVWSCFQAVVMMVQNRFQMRRMYTRIALGRNTAMDVVSGETSSSSGQMFILYPLLLVLQGTQITIGLGVMMNMYTAWLTPEGWYEMESHELDLRGMRGVFLAGLAFFYMGVRNAITTLQTLVEKSKRKARQAKLSKAKSASSLAT